MTEIFELLFTWLIEYEVTNMDDGQVLTSKDEKIDIRVICGKDIQVWLDGKLLPYKETNYKGDRYWKEVSKDRISKMEDYISERLTNV